MASSSASDASWLDAVPLAPIAMAKTGSEQKQGMQKVTRYLETLKKQCLRLRSVDVLAKIQRC